MVDEAKPRSRASRTCLRFSVRGLIVLVLVMGTGLGWLVRSAQIQREAVAAIQKAGGNVWYNWEWKNGAAIPSGEPLAPKWLVDRIGVDYFGHPAGVGLKPASGAALADIAKLSRVEAVRLAGPSVTDHDLAHLKDLTGLSELMLLNANVTNAGLAHLRALSNLSTLDLFRTGVTDAGLRDLKAFTKLTRLGLRYTAVSDDGLLQLEWMQELSYLDLAATKVSDAGLGHLSRLTELETIDLSFTQVTDAGLMRLKGLAKLTALYLLGSQVTSAGINELRMALPNLVVDGAPELVAPKTLPDASAGAETSEPSTVAPIAP